MDSQVINQNGELTLHTWVRRTGRGAVHGSRILTDKGFIPVEDLKDSKSWGREHGFIHLAINITPDVTWGDFYRSNSGREEVHIFIGEREVGQLDSFEEAERWGIKFMQEGEDEIQ